MVLAHSDTAESLSVLARHVLGGMLRLHSHDRAWHYGVLLPPEAPNSLSNYLGITLEELRGVLEVCGLLHRRGKVESLVARMSNSSPYSWDQFLVANDLVGYFDKMSVAKAGFGTKQHWWLRLGKFGGDTTAPARTSRKQQENYNPSTQSKFYSHPPRIGMKKRRLLSALRVKLLSILELVHNEKEEQLKVIDEQGSCPDSSFSSTGVAKGMLSPHEANKDDGNLQELAMTLLNDLQSGVANVKQASEGLVKAVHKSQFEAQRHRMELMMGTSVSKPLVSEDDQCFSRSFPLLASFGIPLCPEFVSPILRELVLLSEMFPKSNILSYTTHRGTECTLLNIPRSRNRDRFQRNVRQSRSHDWLLKLPSLVVDSANSDDDDKSGAAWILEYLGSRYEEEFVNTAKQLGYPVTTKKMPPEHAAAMWQEANISKRAQRTILRHLGSYFGCRLVVPEYEITKLGQNHVPPECGTFELDRKRIHFWTKPLEKSLQVSMQTRLSEVGGALPIPASVDVIVGGDHGKERFRGVVKIVFRDANGKRFDSYVFSVANIDCKKDTYEVLENSVGPLLNQGMQSLVDAGTIQVYRVGGEGAIRVSIGMTCMNEHDAILLQSIPVRVLVSGDLAFFTSVLGKVNMSSHWCIWCNLSRSEWASLDHTAGEPWTVNRLVELRQRRGDAAANGEAVPQAKGVTHKPLFDAVEVDHYIFSVLHAEIGVGNKMLNSFFDWVDLRVEDLSDEEVAARREYFEAVEDWKRQGEAWEAWTDEHGPHLADLYDQRTILNELKKMRGMDGRLIHSPDERREITEDTKLLTAQIKDQLKAKKEQKALVSALDGIVGLKKKQMEKLRKQRGKSARVRSLLEEALVRNGVERSSYHGGDLTGKMVARLFQLSTAVFEEFQAIIMQVQDRLASNDEVRDMCRRYSELAALLDMLFSLARTPSGDASPDICNTTEDCVRKVLRKWRDLRLSMLLPKIHGIEDHLVDMMRRFNGIGCFIEDFIEQAHQTGHKAELRTSNMKDRKRASMSHSLWEFSTWRSGVVKVKAEVVRKTRRKRVAETPTLSEMTQQEKKRRRMNHRQQCLASASLEPNPVDDFMIRTANDFLVGVDYDGVDEAVADD